jgi:hypothetical protein
MLPRERVLAVFQHDIPDRVPVIPKIWIDLAANALEIPYIEVINDPALAMRAIVDAALKLRCDGVRLFIFPKRRVEQHGDQYTQFSPSGATLGSLDMQGGWATRLADDATFNLADEEKIATYQLWHTEWSIIQTRNDIDRMTVPPARFYEQAGYGEMVERALEIAGDQLCCIGDCNSGTLAFHVAMRGLTRALLDLVEEPDLVRASMEKGIQISFERARFFIDRGVKVLRYNDSVANMSIISPKHWRQFIFPPLKIFCDQVHQYDHAAKIYCHICGNVMPIINDLVASGLDCIAPLDPLGGFTVAQAREKVGNDVDLMGGINTLSFVQLLPSEIVEEARQCIEQGGKKGNFILGSGCVVPRDAQLENLFILKDVAEQYGRYAAGALLGNRQ